MILRTYQQEAIEVLDNYLATSEGNPILALPTGTGKSVIIAGFIKNLVQKFPLFRVLVVTHRKELIQQDYDKFLELWPQGYAGIYSAGLDRKDTEPPIIFAGVDSIVRATDSFLYFDYIIIDECHMVTGSDTQRYGKLIGIFKSRRPNLRVIGLTATPYRMDSGLLTRKTVFTDICYNLCALKNFNKLIEEGFLVPVVPYKQEIVYDVSGVRANRDDYILKELQAVVDTSSYTQRICADFIEKLNQGNYNKWLIFSSGLTHAKHIKEELDKHQISSEIVTSKCTDTDRADYIAKFKNGEIRALINYNILTTGFDVPDIDAIVLMRPTKSTVLWVQMLGRGTRPAPGKTHCVVLDYANNTETLGPINDPLVPGTKRKGKGTAPVRECPKCKAFVHIKLLKCPHCEFEFPVIEKLQLKSSSKRLISDGKAKFKWFEVSRMNCQLYLSAAGNLTVLVNYMCKHQNFREYLCFEKEGWVRKRALQWWEFVCKEKAPATCAEVITAYKAGKVKTPKGIKVWTNRPYPQIMEYSDTITTE